jgi:hypothetical protein
MLTLSGKNIGNQLNNPGECVLGVMPWGLLNNVQLNRNPFKFISIKNITYVNVFIQMAVKIPTDAVNRRIVFSFKFNLSISIIINWHRSIRVREFKQEFLFVYSTVVIKQYYVWSFKRMFVFSAFLNFWVYFVRLNRRYKRPVSVRNTYSIIL